MEETTLSQIEKDKAYRDMPIYPYISIQALNGRLQILTLIRFNHDNQIYLTPLRVNRHINEVYDLYVLYEEIEKKIEKMPYYMIPTEKNDNKNIVFRFIKVVNDKNK